MTFIHRSIVILTGLVILQSYCVVVSMDQQHNPFDIGHYLFLGQQRFNLPKQEVKVSGMPIDKEKPIISVTNYTGMPIELTFIFTIPSKPGKTIAISSLARELPVSMQLQMPGKDLLTILSQAINAHPSQILGRIQYPIPFENIITQIRFTSPEADAVLQHKNIGNFSTLKPYETNSGIFEQKEIMYINRDTSTQIAFFTFTFHEKITLLVEKNYNIVRKYYGDNNIKNQIISDFALTTEFTELPENMIQLSPKKQLIPIKEQKQKQQEQQNAEEFDFIDQSPTKKEEKTGEKKHLVDTQKECAIY